MPRLLHSFASDNYAGIHPAVLRAIEEANGGHEIAYGEDSVTSVELAALIEATFGEGAVAFPVFNGTGANVLALQSLLRPWEAVVCVTTAHIQCDEGGAPEKMAGIKLHTVPHDGAGKITPSALTLQLFDRDSVHRAQPGALSISNTTEMGTVYSAEEVRALADAAHANGLLLHMDGARLANAAAALGLPMRAFTRDSGVDILSLGGTKIGAMGAEAVVVLPQPGEAQRATAARLAAALPFLRKSAMQLASKQRFISAQLCALLRGGLALALGAHANAMAGRLEEGVRALCDFGGGAGRGLGSASAVLPTKRAANAIFPVLAEPLVAALQTRFRFYVWNATDFLPMLQVRWMSSWDTSERSVADLVEALREEAVKLGSPIWIS
jgi:threonine aldolase